MAPGNLADLVAQSTTHALVAALAIEALLRAWRVRAPGDRLALRAAGLAQPLLVTPVLWLLSPRRGEEFRDSWAIFASRRWEDVSLGRANAFHAFLLLAAALGVALFLMDLAPLLAGRRRALAPPSPPPPELRRALDGSAAAMGMGAPPLHYLDARAPSLFCAGVRRPLLVVSRGALEALGPRELEAALSHELAHLRHLDPALSWALMAARGLLFFNPTAQVVARAVARDAEWRADEDARCDRLALASALVKLHRAGTARPLPAPRTLPLAGALTEPMRRARSHDVIARCRRLMDPAPSPPTPQRAARLALTVASLAALAFFVT